VWSGACPIRPPTVGKRHAHKQPANLAVEGAEESLFIIPDYTPTVRPPPKRCGIQSSALPPRPLQFTVASARAKFGHFLPRRRYTAGTPSAARWTSQ
jgi:hypothetical protein